MLPLPLDARLRELRAGAEHLAAHRAPHATEPRFAAYESARRGQRIDLLLAGES